MSIQVSIKDIARVAEVSVAAVSYTLNGKGDRYRIAHDTQARIRAIAVSLGYQPNSLARDIQAKNWHPADSMPIGTVIRREIGLVLGADSPSVSLALIPKQELLLAAESLLGRNPAATLSPETPPAASAPPPVVVPKPIPVVVESIPEPAPDPVVAKPTAPPVVIPEPTLEPEPVVVPDPAPTPTTVEVSASPEPAVATPEVAPIATPEPTLVLSLIHISEPTRPY